MALYDGRVAGGGEGGMVRGEDDRPPWLSFLVAVRNRPAKIVRALQALPLGSPGIEVVVVDDGSTDDTLAVVEREFGDRVVLRRHETRRGAGPARNTAAREATGEWCFVYDSDNELLPGGVDAVHEAVTAYGDRVGVIYMGSVLASGQATGTKDVPDGVVAFGDLLAERVKGEYCTVARRSAMVEFPYNETPGRDTPAVTWRQIARKYGVAAVDTPVLRYDDTGADRVSDRAHSLDDPVQAAWCHHRMLEVFPEMREVAPEVWAEHLARSAFFRALAGDRRAAARETVASLRVAPRRSAMAAAGAAIAGPRITRYLYGR
jgi:glycosyltransferase involved in cell wall biosynthesis